MAARRRRANAVTRLTAEASQAHELLLSQDKTGLAKEIRVNRVTGILTGHFKDAQKALRAYRELVAHRLVVPGERVGREKEFTVFRSPTKVAASADKPATRRHAPPKAEAPQSGPRRRRRGSKVSARTKKTAGLPAPSLNGVAALFVELAGHVKKAKEIAAELRRHGLFPDEDEQEEIVLRLKK